MPSPMIVGAARLGRFNDDGEGISFSEVAKHYRRESGI